jgi:hypothetical protein
VSAQTGREAVARRPADGTDRRGDVAEPAAGLAGGDAGLECPPGVGRERARIGADHTDLHRQRGVAVVAVDVRAAVDRQQVALAQRPLAGDAVHDLVVDRQAQHPGVRHRRPAWLVTEERRLGAAGGDVVGGQLVQVDGQDAGCGRRRDRREGFGDDATGLAHHGKLGGTLEHDHGGIVIPGLESPPWCALP